MYGLEGMKKYSDVVTDLVAHAGTGTVDHRAKIGDVFDGYTGGLMLNTSDGEAELQSKAASDLFGKIGLPVSVLKHFNGYPDLQRGMVDVKLRESGRGDDTVILRGIRDAEEGQISYQAVVSEEYLPVGNVQLLMGLEQSLPDNALVHRANVRNRSMIVRIVSEDWYHDLGPGGAALTSLIVSNDELGKAKLVVRVGLARVACWNYSIYEEPVFEHAHRWISPMEVGQGIDNAIARLDDIGGNIAGRLMEYQDINVNDVEQMIRVMSGEMKLPVRVQRAANEWWEEQGATPTLFWVIQALSWGVGAMTDNVKNPMWNKREKAEFQTLNMATHFSATGELEVCSCRQCGRPMEVYEEPAVEAEYTIE